MSTIDITAPTMIAWSEPSPSSPAPAARRCAASGLDRSVRPSKVVGHAVDATSQYLKNPTSTFTEIAYTKYRTFPRAAPGDGAEAPPGLYGAPTCFEHHIAEPALGKDGLSHFKLWRRVTV